MSRLPYAAVTLLFLAAYASTEGLNSTETDYDADSCDLQESCALHDEAGPWSALLQEWAVTASDYHGRHGRIMALPPAQGYYVSERMDGLVPPPLAPPAPLAPQAPLAPLAPQAPLAPRPYTEWQRAPPPGAGKIVNRPPNPYKDKFKPSYPAPAQSQPQPAHGNPDRADEPRPSAHKVVSETDLYLLSAIEKLVYRADFMEKRLRKIELTVNYLMTGVDPKSEPCAVNYTRVGGACYHVSSEPANWKAANYGCRRLTGSLLEIDSDDEHRKLAAALLVDKRLKGGDFWTGGLNPGLLWIWSHSARPVVTNSTGAATNSSQPHSQSASIVGEGRCLAWVRDPATNSYVYRGQDCALPLRYICEQAQDQDKLSDQIERVARHVRRGRTPNIVWTDDQS